MYCPKCGTYLKDNAIFCYKCGTRIADYMEGESDSPKEEPDKEEIIIEDDDSKAATSNENLCFEIAIFDKKTPIRKGIVTYVQYKKKAAENIGRICNKAEEMYAEAVQKDEIKDIFDKRNVLNKIGDKASDEVRQICYGYLGEFGVYDVSRVTFLSNTYYCSGYLSQLDKKLGNIESRLKAEKDEITYNREHRRTYVGGGFGVRGAIKGEITADMLNLGRGLLCLPFEVSRSIESDSQARAKRNALFKEDDGCREFFSKLPNSLEWFITTCLDYICDCVDDGSKICCISEDEREQAKDLLDVIDSGAVPKSKMVSQYNKCINNDPWNIFIYVSILYNMPERAENVRLACAKLDLDFEEVIYEYLSNYCYEIDDSKYIDFYDVIDFTTINTVIPTIEQVEKFKEITESNYKYLRNAINRLNLVDKDEAQKCVGTFLLNKESGYARDMSRIPSVMVDEKFNLEFKASDRNSSTLDEEIQLIKDKESITDFFVELKSVNNNGFTVDIPTDNTEAYDVRIQRLTQKIKDNDELLVSIISKLDSIDKTGYLSKDLIPQLTDYKNQNNEIAIKAVEILNKNRETYLAAEKAKEEIAEQIKETCREKNLSRKGCILYFISNLCEELSKENIADAVTINDTSCDDLNGKMDTRAYNKLRESLGIDYEEKVYYLYDLTIFGKGKYGNAITDKGFYIKEFLCKRLFVPFKDINLITEQKDKESGKSDFCIKLSDEDDRILYLNETNYDALYNTFSMMIEVVKTIYEVLPDDGIKTIYKTPKTLFCKYCGAKVESDFKFCRKCGNKIVFKT